MENLHGVRAPSYWQSLLAKCRVPGGKPEWCVGVSNALVPLAITEGSVLGFILLGAFISALDDELGAASCNTIWGAIPNWSVVCILEDRTGVQRGLEKWFDGSLLILEWVKVQILQLGRKEKPHTSRCANKQPC